VAKFFSTRGLEYHFLRMVLAMVMGCSFFFFAEFTVWARNVLVSAELTAHVGSFFAFAEFAAYVRPGCLAG
jgi:hypothetical protein